ncbi:hypothetical protein HYW42_04300 [Candidatus Daviesbacteria bacterium]|nr:hypothetical protein [Candidatus Daviesbacteria bacterium]
MFKLILITYIFFNLWYFLVVTSFTEKTAKINDSPVLRARLGTVLWHSGDRAQNASGHLYCLYPSGQNIFDNKRGEYIIKRAENIEECQGWYGKVILYEGPWVSEREKIWWNKNQMIEENFASLAKPIEQI